MDDSLGPLGPLGDNFEPPESAQVDGAPTPPYKDTSASHNLPERPITPKSSVTGANPISADLNDDGESSVRARIPPPVRPPTVSPPQSQRQNQPSVPVEQAAKPSFEITVGDPHKVGDLTSSHTVYQVRTKVRKLLPVCRSRIADRWLGLATVQTTSKAYRQPEFAVSRRYRDFLWLYTQLHTNNPGVVVPPPPEKQVVGRFDSSFVESRRAALERMLNKSAAHPILQHDGDLKLFLESDAFSVDVKHKERKESGLGENKGMLSSIGLSGSSSGKFVEQDDVRAF